jgi:hypothetical protein
VEEGEVHPYHKAYSAEIVSVSMGRPDLNKVWQMDQATSTSHEISDGSLFAEALQLSLPSVFCDYASAKDSTARLALA